MTMTLECVEPRARPNRRGLSVEAGREVALYLLPDAPDAGSTLRRTVLCQQDENPPARSRLVLWLLADASGLTVTETSRRLNVELVRADLRSQLVAGMRLPNGASLTIQLPDRSRVSFSLYLQQPLAQSAAASVSAGGTRKSRIIYGTDNVWWLVTDLPDVTIGLGRKLWDGFRDKLQGVGFSGQAFGFFSGFAIAGALGGLVAWNRNLALVDATARASSAEEGAALAQAARDASLATEIQCMVARQELADQLGELQEERALSAEAALQLPLAQGVGLEVGGRRMGDRAVLAYDQLLRASLVEAVVQRLDQEALGEPEGCLAMSSALGADLPHWLLLWHPDPTVACPEGYSGFAEGVDLVGPWGLSTRVAREFGEAGDRGTGTRSELLEEVLGDDPRQEPRWAAFTLAQAFRTVQESLLGWDGTPRPVALPSEAQLWSLAVLDAYNRMPSPAEGTLDATASECVEAMLVERAATLPPLAPGEPILPSITTVALGDDVVSVRPTAACPWPRDALRTGAENALRAAARIASRSAAASRP